MSADHIERKAGTPFIRKPPVPLVAEAFLLKNELCSDEDILENVVDVLMVIIKEGNARGFTLKELFDALERELIVKALFEFNGHQKKTADFLRLRPTTLGEKLKKHRIVIRYKCIV
jgi:DNA-binding NtrC family response regulator